MDADAKAAASEVTNISINLCGIFTGVFGLEHNDITDVDDFQIASRLLI